MPEPGPKRPPVWGREMQPESIKMNARPGPLLKNQMPDVRNTLFSCIILIPLLLIFKPPAVDRYRRNKLNGNLPWMTFKYNNGEPKWRTKVLEEFKLFQYTVNPTRERRAKILFIFSIHSTNSIVVCVIHISYPLIGWLDNLPMSWALWYNISVCTLTPA